MKKVLLTIFCIFIFTPIVFAGIGDDLIFYKKKGMTDAQCLGQIIEPCSQLTKEEVGILLDNGFSADIIRQFKAKIAALNKDERAIRDKFTIDSLIASSTKCSTITANSSNEKDFTNEQYQIAVNALADLRKDLPVCKDGIKYTIAQLVKKGANGELLGLIPGKASSGNNFNLTIKIGINKTNYSASCNVIYPALAEPKAYRDFIDGLISQGVIKVLE